MYQRMLVPVINRKDVAMEQVEIERKRILNHILNTLSDLPIHHLRVYDETIDVLSELPFDRLRIIPVVLCSVLLRESTALLNRRQILRRRHAQTRKPLRTLQAYGPDEKQANLKTSSNVVSRLR